MAILDESEHDHQDEQEQPSILNTTIERDGIPSVSAMATTPTPSVRAALRTSVSADDNDDHVPTNTAIIMSSLRDEVRVKDQVLVLEQDKIQRLQQQLDFKQTELTSVKTLLQTLLQQQPSPDDTQQDNTTTAAQQTESLTAQIEARKAARQQLETMDASHKSISDSLEQENAALKVHVATLTKQNSALQRQNAQLQSRLERYESPADATVTSVSSTRTLGNSSNTYIPNTTGRSPSSARSSSSTAASKKRSSSTTTQTKKTGNDLMSRLQLRAEKLLQAQEEAASTGRASFDSADSNSPNYNNNNTSHAGALSVATATSEDDDHDTNSSNDGEHKNSPQQQHQVALLQRELQAAKEQTTRFRQELQSLALEKQTLETQVLELSNHANSSSHHTPTTTTIPEELPDLKPITVAEQNRQEAVNPDSSGSHINNDEEQSKLVNDLQEANAHLQDELATAKAQLLEQQTSAQVLSTELDDIQRELVQARRRNSNLQIQSTSLYEQTSILQEKVADHTTLESQVKELQREIMQVEQEKSNVLVQNANLQEQIATLQEQNESKLEANANLLQETTQLQEQLTTLQTEKKDLEERLKEAHVELDETVQLQQKLVDLAKKYEQEVILLRSNNDNSRSSNNNNGVGNESRSDDPTQGRERSQATVVPQDAQGDETNDTEKEELLAKNASLQEQVLLLESQVVQSKAECTQLQQQINDLTTKQQEELEKTVQEMSATQPDKPASQEDSKDKQDELVTNNTTLQEQVVELESQLSQSKTESAQLLQQIQDFTTKYEEELDKALRDLSDMQADKSKLQEELAASLSHSLDMDTAATPTATRQPSDQDERNKLASENASLQEQLGIKELQLESQASQHKTETAELQQQIVVLSTKHQEELDSLHQQLSTINAIVQDEMMAKRSTTIEIVPAESATARIAELVDRVVPSNGDSEEQDLDRELAQEREELESNLAAIELKLGSLEAYKESAEIQLKSRQEEVEKLRAELNRYQSESQREGQLGDQQSSDISDSDPKARSSTADEAETSLLLEQANDKLVQLKEENADLKSQLAIYLREKVASDNESDKQQEFEAQKLIVDAEVHGEHIASLRSRVAEKELELQQLRVNLLGKEAEIAKLEAKVSEKPSLHATASRPLDDSSHDDHEVQSARLSAGLVELKDQMAAMESKFSEEDGISAEEVHRLSKELQEHRQRCEKFMEMNKQLRNAIKEEDQMCQELTAKLISRNGERKSYVEIVAKQKDKLNAEAEERKQLLDKIAKLEKDLSLSGPSLKQVSKKDQQEDREDFLEKIEALREENSKLQSKFEKAKKQVMDKDKKLLEQVDELEEVAETVGNLRAEISRLRYTSTSDNQSNDIELSSANASRKLPAEHAEDAEDDKMLQEQKKAVEDLLAAAKKQEEENDRLKARNDTLKEQVFEKDKKLIELGGNKASSSQDESAASVAHSPTMQATATNKSLEELIDEINHLREVVRLQEKKYNERRTAELESQIQQQKEEVDHLRQVVARLEQQSSATGETVDIDLLCPSVLDNMARLNRSSYDELPELIQTIAGDDMVGIRSALSQLTHVLHKEKEGEGIRVALFRAGGHLVFVKAMKRHRGSPDIQEECCRLLSALCEVNKTVSYSLVGNFCIQLASLGVLESLLATMESNSNDLRLLKKAFRALNNIMSAKDIARLFFDLNMFPLITKNMTNFPSDPTIQEDGCRILRFTAINPQAKDIFKREGVLRMLASNLERFDEGSTTYKQSFRAWQAIAGAA